MQRFPAVLALDLSGALCAAPALAQPSGAPDQAARVVNTYVYLMDGGNNRVLVSTNFWRNDAKYDDRAFHRFMEVLAALEKKGFRMDTKAVIDSWDKPAPYVRCYVYLEDLQIAQKGKGAVVAQGHPREVRPDRGVGAAVHHLRHAGVPGIPGRQTGPDLHRLGHPHPQHQRLESPLLHDDRRPLRELSGNAR